MTRSSSHRTISAQDEEIAEQICELGEYGGQRYSVGQFVAILSGKVVAVGEDFEQVNDKLSRRTPDRQQGIICQVAPPVLDVIRPTAAVSE